MSKPIVGDTPYHGTFQTAPHHDPFITQFASFNLCARAACVCVCVCVSIILLMLVKCEATVGGVLLNPADVNCNQCAYKSIS